MDETQPPQEIHEEPVQGGHEEAGQGVNGRLEALGIDPSKLLSSAGAEAEQAEAEAQRKEAEVQSWREAVDAVHADTARLKEGLESRLKNDVENGFVRTEEAATKRLSDIDAQVARGPARSRTYNGYPGSPYLRTQTYYVTVDEGGNIWGDFVPGKDEIGITGKPISPGKHIVHENPTIKR